MFLKARMIDHGSTIVISEDLEPGKARGSGCKFEKKILLHVADLYTYALH